MAKYTIESITRLVNKIQRMPKIANKALQNTVNRSATFTIKESIKHMTRQNALTSGYLRDKFQITARASRTKLRTKIRANDRETLLSKYPYRKTKEGVSVTVKRGRPRLIKKAKIVSLRSGNGKGIALTNKQFYRYYKTNKPAKSTSRDLGLALRKSVNKPFGTKVLHAASVDQMFRQVREDVKPELNRFMTEEFFDQFRKISNK